MSTPREKTRLGPAESPAGEPLAAPVAHLLRLQLPSGAWEGEMVWSTIILSEYVIVHHVTGRALDEATRRGIVKHYHATQLDDGSWGLHPESAGYVFVTALAYVALRLLGLEAEDPLVAPARRWLRAQPGGVLAIPTWGKYWLAFLDLYGWEGVNPCPPELFLLPESLPLHPHHYYCHTRNIYTGLAYLYGRRFHADLGALRDALRAELYGEPWDRLDFGAHRHQIAASDCYVRPGAGLRRSMDLLMAFERVAPARLRRRAVDRCLTSVIFEQRATRYQALSPVNGLLDCLALYAADRAHPDLDPSLAGLEAWRWEDEAEGVRFAGARSQTWDTAFAMQALLADRGIAERAAAPLGRAYQSLLDTQVTEEVPGFAAEHRDHALGGWCFSDGRHRWPVSDCTAEALSAILQAHRVPGLIPMAARISGERLRQAVEFLLTRQNADGGFGTYERRRGTAWLESLNPTEMFGSCMTESSYVECTASSAAALAELRRAGPALLGGEVEHALGRALDWLRAAQHPDGSYPGFWGIYSTYALFHVLKALAAAGVPAGDATVRRGISWLIAHQRADGGWGEHFASCLAGRYLEHPRSQAVMTAWALLGLVAGGAVLDPAVERGVAWLRAVERPDGSFPQQAVTGVFFGSAMLDYRLYKAYFPAWALTLVAVARRQAEAS